MKFTCSSIEFIKDQDFTLLEAGQRQGRLPGEGSISAWFLKDGHAELEKHLQFSSVTQLCQTLCDPMDCSMPGFPVHHQLLELDQTHVHRVASRRL